MSGPKIISQSGKLIDVLNPQPEDFNIEDIAAGLVLGKTERYGSRSRPRYFVAEHSVHCANLFAAKLNAGIIGPHPLTGERLLKGVLLHDAAEAYLGDIVQPLKSVLPDYRSIESEFEHSIAERFELPIGIFGNPMVKWIDQRIFRCEVRNLALDGPEKYGLDGRENFETTQELFEILPSLRHMGWDAKKAKHEFLSLCEMLSIK